MKCSKCGKKINTGQKFCIYCGEKISDNVQDTRSSETKLTDIEKNTDKASEVTPDTGITEADGRPVCQTATDDNSKEAPPETENRGNAGDAEQPKKPVNNSSVPDTRTKRLSSSKGSGVILLSALQALVGLVLAALIALFPFWSKAASLNIGGENPIVREYSFIHIINSLIFGSDKYNPTVLSVAAGTGALIFVFSASFFWVIYAVCALIRKGYNGMRRISVILTFFATASLCSLLFLADRFVPQFKLIYARDAGVLIEEMKGLTSILSYIWAGIILLLIIITWILAIKRKKKERSCANNEK